MDTQTLVIFQQLVDFVKNIDNYSDVVAQIKVATDAHSAAYNQLSQGKTLAQYEASLDKIKEQLDLERTEFDKACQAQLDSFKSRTKVLDATESALTDQFNNQKANQVLLDGKFAELDKKTVDLNKREFDLNAQIEVNNQLTKELTSKKQQLAKLLG